MCRKAYSPVNPSKTSQRPNGKRFRRENPLDLTRDEVKAICRAYTVLKVRVEEYRRRRSAIVGGSGSSVVTIQGTKTGPSDPTLSKVSALETLEQRYLQALAVTWAMDECLAAMGKESEKIFNLYFVKGLPVREVGVRLGMTKSAVHRRANKILDTIGYWLTREKDTWEATQKLTRML
jgi:DNA-directed RNA polymerase specialized sigma24 family protein